MLDVLPPFAATSHQHFLHMDIRPLGQPYVRLFIYLFFIRSIPIMQILTSFSVVDGD